MNKKIVRDVDTKNKTVLIRVDFNVPIDKEGNIADDTRIAKALPTINYLLEQNAKIVLISHLGKPEGKVIEELRLDPVFRRLKELLKDQTVIKLNDCIGIEVQEEIKKAEKGNVILLENLRFHPGEEENDPKFAKQLAGLADIFVNDAFGTAHRAHASTEGITKLLPSVAGFLLEKEVDILTKAMENPKRPLVGIIGGVKISTKIKVIRTLLEKADYLLLGGALANTILQAQGIQIGKSITEEEMIEEAKKIVIADKKLKIPVDVITAKELKEGVSTNIVGVGKVAEDQMILDIGPDTFNLFSSVIKEAKTIIWNGPMGVFEIKDFAQGTENIAKTIAGSSAYTIVGGGETVDVIRNLGLEDKIDHVSTGGGAMLEFIEGKELPGIAALEDR